MKYCFGVDVGGTTVKLGLFTVEGELLDKWEIKTYTENEGERILPDVTKAIKEKIAEKKLAADEICGIGVGVPAPVDKNGAIERAANVGWKAKEIKKELEEAEQYFLQATEDEELCADAYLELAKIYLIKNDKDKAIQYANVAIQENPKRIVEKIRNDVTFAIIIAKLSIPFNLEIEEEEKKHKLTKKEIKAKEHLEQMVEITKKIGYNDVGIHKRDIKIKDEDYEINNQKERE